MPLPPLLERPHIPSVRLTPIKITMKPSTITLRSPGINSKLCFFLCHHLGMQLDVPQTCFVDENNEQRFIYCLKMLTNNREATVVRTEPAARYSFLLNLMSLSTYPPQVLRPCVISPLPLILGRGCREIWDPNSSPSVLKPPAVQSSFWISFLSKRSVC